MKDACLSEIIGSSKLKSPERSFELQLLHQIMLLKNVKERVAIRIMVGNKTDIYLRCTQEVTQTERDQAMAHGFGKVTVLQSHLSGWWANRIRNISTYCGPMMIFQKSKRFT